jgi:hypothetical protein
MLAWIRVAVWCGAVALGHGNLSGAASLAGLDRVQVSPVPDWVRMVEWARPDSPRGGKSEGTRHLAYEWQSNPGREETFIRVVTLMQNEAGVQDSGSLTFHYDPEYQELLLHRIQLHGDWDRTGLVSSRPTRVDDGAAVWGLQRQGTAAVRAVAVRWH